MSGLGRVEDRIFSIREFLDFEILVVGNFVVDFGSGI